MPPAAAAAAMDVDEEEQQQQPAAEPAAGANPTKTFQRRTTRQQAQEQQQPGPEGTAAGTEAVEGGDLEDRPDPKTTAKAARRRRVSGLLGLKRRVVVDSGEDAAAGACACGAWACQGPARPSKHPMKRHVQKPLAAVLGNKGCRRHIWLGLSWCEQGVQVLWWVVWRAVYAVAAWCRHRTDANTKVLGKHPFAALRRLYGCVFLIGCCPVLLGAGCVAGAGGRPGGGRHNPTELPAAEIRALLADRAPLLDMEVGGQPLGAGFSQSPGSPFGLCCNFFLMSTCGIL